MSAGPVAPHPRLEGYKELVERFGIGRVADAILRKWMSEPDHPGWERLNAYVENVPSPAYLRFKHPFPDERVAAEQHDLALSA